MKPRLLLSLVICLLIWVPSPGQDKTPLLDAKYLRDHAQTRGFMLGRPMQPKFTPDGKNVLFLRSQARNSRMGLFEYNVASGQSKELVTPEQILKGGEEKLTPEEKARRERMRMSGAGITSFQLSPDGKLLLVGLGGRLFTIDRASQTIQELKTGPGVLDPKFSPDNSMIAYVRDHDVFVVDLKSNQERRVTKGGTELVAHGEAEFVAQEEMDRFSGYWWSPDSQKIVYQESDAKGVEVWHVADPANPGDTPTPFFYPRPGKANVKVKLGIISVQGGDTTWIDWDQTKYPYLATVRWPQGGPLMAAVQTRDQKEITLLQVDPKTGKTTPLLTETDPAWVNIHQIAPYWLPDNSGFLWISERDGGPQLELRQVNGRLRRVVVGRNEGFQGLVGVVGDNSDLEIVYNASFNPTQSHLYRVTLREGGEPKPLTKEAGLHGAIFSKSGDLWLHMPRTLAYMPTVLVRQADGTVIGELPSVAEKPPFSPKVELTRVGPGEGFEAAVIWPRNFDPAKKYPVMVDVYGGPHHQHVVASRQRWMLDQWYADQGFIVVAIDGRGTPGRGRAWERAIYQKFGSVPLDDQVAGLQALGERYPNMDLKRVGIDGWSFGGYMGALAVLKRPDVFHAGVAGAPVCDWLDYDTHYTERYLGIPPKDDPAYQEGSLLTYAPSLKRPLLILHGTADDNVYFRHSLKLVDALFRNGKDFELVPLSGLTHMVPNPLVMERLHTRISDFLKKNLGKPEVMK